MIALALLAMLVMFISFVATAAATLVWSGVLKLFRRPQEPPSGRALVLFIPLVVIAGGVAYLLFAVATIWLEPSGDTCVPPRIEQIECP